MKTETVKLSTLKELADANSVRGVAIVGQKGGFEVHVRYGAVERVLAAKTGEPRLFAKIDTAADLLRRELGFVQFSVDASRFDRTAGVRSDRGVALRKIHQAAKHDAWFRGEVQKSVDKVTGGKAVFTDHDTVFDELEASAALGTVQRDGPRAKRPATARR